jgi:hypothetical protein
MRGRSDNTHESEEERRILDGGACCPDGKTSDVSRMVWKRLKIEFEDEQHLPTLG